MRGMFFNPIVVGPGGVGRSLPRSWWDLGKWDGLHCDPGGTWGREIFSRCFNAQSIKKDLFSISHTLCAYNGAILKK